MKIDDHKSWGEFFVWLFFLTGHKNHIKPITVVKAERAREVGKIATCCIVFRIE